MNTTENNKLIAEFMGAKYDKDTTFPIHKNDLWLPNHGVCNFVDNNGKSLKFHSDWNWLMEVVEKIELEGHKLSNISKYIHNNKTIFDLKLSEVNIVTVYDYVVEFIIWYNQQNK